MTRGAASRWFRARSSPNRMSLYSTRHINTTALASVGFSVLVANYPSDIAQSLFVAHALANSFILSSRADMLEDLVVQRKARNRSRAHSRVRENEFMTFEVQTTQCTLHRYVPSIRRLRHRVSASAVQTQRQHGVE